MPNRKRFSPRVSCVGDTGSPAASVGGTGSPAASVSTPPICLQTVVGIGLQCVKNSLRSALFPASSLTSTATLCSPSVQPSFGAYVSSVSPAFADSLASLPSTVSLTSCTPTLSEYRTRIASVLAARKPCVSSIFGSVQS